MLAVRKKRGSGLLKLSSSSVLLVPGLMYLKGEINADSILTFSGGETRDTQSQQEGSGSDVLIVLSIKAADQRQPNRRSIWEQEYAHTAASLCPPHGPQCIHARTRKKTQMSPHIHTCKQTKKSSEIGPHTGTFSYSYLNPLLLFFCQICEYESKSDLRNSPNCTNLL